LPAMFGFLSGFPFPFPPDFGPFPLQSNLSPLWPVAFHERLRVFRSFVWSLIEAFPTCLPPTRRFSDCISFFCTASTGLSWSASTIIQLVKPPPPFHFSFFLAVLRFCRFPSSRGFGREVFCGFISQFVWFTPSPSPFPILFFLMSVGTPSRY